MRFRKAVTISLSFVLSLIGVFAIAQNRASLSAGEKAASWAALDKDIMGGFATSSIRFDKDVPPQLTQSDKWTGSGWKGEKLHTQLLVWGRKGIKNLQIITTDLRDKRGNTIINKNITVGFIQYVMTDEFKGGCGYRKPADFDSSLVADIINTSIPSIAVKENNVQPLWLSVSIPANTVAGLYSGTITVKADKDYKLNVSLNVINKTLPPPAQWKYQLDLWQHPAAIARVHNVSLWSDEHFSLMRKYYTMLARAGQKNITASIVNEPWGHQTYDDYPGLVKWTKKKNGEWAFDYSLFDKYVSFVMSCGIKSRINCYSMVPWKIAFSYYDESFGRDTVFTGAIGTPEYNAFWGVMLKDFTRHLKEKKWFAITTIAMDERPMEAMQSVIALLQSIDKNWKVALAGNYHPEIEKDVYDYCVASEWKFPEEVLKRRQQEGKISTWYTCCVEQYPNGFTFSPPDEHVWMGWYTAHTQMNGYLRWAFNSWTKNPLQDSRFSAWPAGDTYQVYPGPLSSIRFEKMIEGIQDYEKIEILRGEYRKKKQFDKLNELDTALKGFEIKNLSQTSAAAVLREVKSKIN